ncbi:MAG: hypothetical protein sL5_06340 [Candidatus Mesenet longicola]|uniref:Uncharacterized protein n=1 Tax=Candidatus Mesenet longicola TaxID=1892558 RepID=A0A8J3HY12_9RICK|nr:MAG: hypothetical protein sGL2_06550 [Candidatus Mesenet longicola]GHM59641.1 MAG: hypothetical protein sL5_06340 [Candidatus Mesenet longicola]
MLTYSSNYIKYEEIKLLKLILEGREEVKGKDVSKRMGDEEPN